MVIGKPGSSTSAAQAWTEREQAQAAAVGARRAFLDSRFRVTGYLREDLRTLLTESGFTIEHEQALSYAPETSSAQPEIQMFFLCRKADERS